MFNEPIRSEVLIAIRNARPQDKITRAGTLAEQQAGHPVIIKPVGGNRVTITTVPGMSPINVSHYARDPNSGVIFPVLKARPQAGDGNYAAMSRNPFLFRNVGFSGLSDPYEGMGDLGIVWAALPLIASALRPRPAATPRTTATVGGQSARAAQLAASQGQRPPGVMGLLSSIPGLSSILGGSQAAAPIVTSKGSILWAASGKMVDIGNFYLLAASKGVPDDIIQQAKTLWGTGRKQECADLVNNSYKSILAGGTGREKAGGPGTKPTVTRQGMPSWAIPAAIGVAALFLLRKKGRK